ncbi:MAG: helix-turn-helix domain-containing protein [Chloroflexi bacterium]|nr:helix-turn-helix domain-containing protein [Chloroflexota bacterium]
MRAFLSIKEAADVLGVQYNTIYRLVRDGTLPAARIRRVYRIKAEDLLAYFEAQKTILHDQDSVPTDDPDPTSPVHPT